MPPEGISTIALDRLNAADAAEFADLLAGIVEHAPEIAKAAARHRPFATVGALHKAFFAEIAAMSPDEHAALVNRHPELAGREAEAGEMTAESVSEQGGAGLDSLSAADATRLRRLNAAYRERFGFPYMICVRRHTLDSIFQEAERRLARGREEELEEALRQIFLVTRLRVVDRVHGPGLPRTTGELAAIVTDGDCPVAGVRLELRDERGIVLVRETDEDGGAIMISGQPLRIGSYELLVDRPDTSQTTIVKLRVDCGEASYRLPVSFRASRET